jgi:hypothetical protein
MRRRAALALAVLLLNVSLTFRNIWPTPAVKWSGDLSIELAIAILGLAVAWRWCGAVRRGWVRGVAVVWTLLVVGRYVDVTAPALYGRDINLYWDLRFVPDVAAMFLTANPALVGVLVALAALLVVLYFVVSWALRRIVRAMDEQAERRLVVGTAAAAAVLFGVGMLDPDWPGPSFTKPVTASYVDQARLAATAVAKAKSLPDTPPFDSDLSLVAGADVLLTFMESYGAITYQRPAFDEALADSRAELDAAIRAGGREVVSAYVQSPTFGGSSWFAHLSLLSGIDVRDPDTNALLMAQKRDTLVTLFDRHGYRTVAIMPGLWQLWPEGAFYRFDDIYGGERLGYRGPEFGWWAIPDQFAFARLRELELGDGDRPPSFVFFPTVSTHTPFTPAPPYQPDWQRVVSAEPYDVADVEHAFNQLPDWTNLSPSYVNAVQYGFASITGFLREHRGRDFVMILLGDHQPPALVTGEGASWDVPVHVIASRRAVLERLLTHGFRRGLRPEGRSIARMHALLPILLDAFGNTKGTKDAKETTGTKDPEGTKNLKAARQRT